jgi:23S rRNA (uracil1939-C5)-methyltransferase
MSSTDLRPGDVIEVTAERLAYGGEAVARHGGLTVFVALAAPGDRLRVRVIERKKRFARAVIEEILTPSASRREPPCGYFGRCGGCQLQHVSYAAQVEAKAGFVRDALSRIGRIEWPGEIEVRTAQEFGYRARAQVKVASQNQGGAGNVLSIGFNRAGSHDVCDVAACPILTPALGEGLTQLRSSLEAARGRGGAGLPPEVEIAAGGSGVAFEPALPGLSSGPVTASVAGIDYRFSPATFFQANPLLLESLVAEAVDERSGKLAIDLYAGAGLFTLHLARRFDRVIGVESNAGAARFARENISDNRIANVEFFNAAVERWLEGFYSSGRADDSPPPDLVLMDPPRGGAAEAIARIIDLRPREISYVSCDPATLSRDLRRLIDAGYELTSVTAFDLFPQTYHVETVAALTRGD